ncbi:excisionase family protein [Grimontia sp. NTOU-MAR1]|uniref:excisionase family protein n=1 Tax=Grimontia sp. NTOU-MAR1 TaxID=3111011 RepID=UPI003FA38569
MLTGEIENYRNHVWREGIHYKRVSSQGNPNARGYFYNTEEIDRFFDNTKAA